MEIVISDPNGEEVVGTFYKNELQTNLEEFKMEKVIKKKFDKFQIKLEKIQ